MKRRIIKTWDSTNGTLYARVYRVYTDEANRAHCCYVQEYKGGYMARDAKACKGMMRKYGSPQWIGKAFVRELSLVLR